MTAKWVFREDMRGTALFDHRFAKSRSRMTGSSSAANRFSKTSSKVHKNIPRIRHFLETPVVEFPRCLSCPIWANYFIKREPLVELRLFLNRSRILTNLPWLWRGLINFQHPKHGAIQWRRVKSWLVRFSSRSQQLHSIWLPLICGLHYWSRL